MAASKIPTSNVLAIRTELDILKQDQDSAMAVSVYTGMTPAQAKEFDIRRHRINELYESLLVLTSQTR